MEKTSEPSAASAKAESGRPEVSEAEGIRGVVEKTAPRVQISELRCPYCHDAIRKGEAPVGCRSCHALHHDACLQEAGSCSACRAPIARATGEASQDSAIDRSASRVPWNDRVRSISVLTLLLGIGGVIGFLADTDAHDARLGLGLTGAALIASKLYGLLPDERDTMLRRLSVLLGSFAASFLLYFAYADSASRAADDAAVVGSVALVPASLLFFFGGRHSPPRVAVSPPQSTGSKLKGE